MTLLRAWKMQYFVLKDATLFQFPNKGTEQSRRIPLFQCDFQPFTRPEEPNIWAFKIIAATKTITLKAESEMEMHSWVNALLKQRILAEEFVNTVKTV